jgi:hypothetical protein
MGSGWVFGEVEGVGGFGESERWGWVLLGLVGWFVCGSARRCCGGVFGGLKWGGGVEGCMEGDGEGGEVVEVVEVWGGGYFY